MNNTAKAPAVASSLEPLADLVARVDLVGIVDEVAGSHKLVGGRAAYACPNPQHDDGTPSFFVFVDKVGRQRWRCYGCAEGGDALDFVAWHYGTTTTDAIKRLRQMTGTTPAAPSRAPNMPPRSAVTSPPPVTPSLAAPVDMARRLPEHDANRLLIRYAAARGWPVDVADRYGVEIVQHSGGPWARHHYYVPTLSGPVAFGWQDRALRSNPSTRWTGPKGWAPTLWGRCTLDTATANAVVICEGPADGISASWALEGYGPVAVVAIPGVAGWRPDYCQLFDGRNVVLALDDDTPGRATAAKIAADLEGVAATVDNIDRTFETADLCDILRTFGPHFLAALLLEPFNKRLAADTAEGADTIGGLS